MWMMMQQEKPDDFVIATGETHSVAEFAEAAFGVVDLNWKDYVVTDERLQRPMDVHQLLGSAKKAEDTFGWKSNVTFKELVKIMVEADLHRWQKHLNGEVVPWDAPNHSAQMDIVSRNVVKDAKREAGKDWQKENSNVEEIKQEIPQISKIEESISLNQKSVDSDKETESTSTNNLY
jgi:hypothetical protein